MRKRGFTLVEVLVALVIVAIGMSAVLATLTSAADTTLYLREKSFAEWVAMNRIAELRLQARRAAAGKDSGEAEFAGRRWRWEQEIVKLDVPGTYRIDVRVRPNETATRNAAWVATVTGIMGDAVAPPDGVPGPWSEQIGRGPQGVGPVPTQPVEPSPGQPLEPEPQPDPQEPQPNTQ
jgi:general secretion pathway protein I